MLTLKEHLEKFPDEDSCKRYLAAKRWPDGVRCPKCGNGKVFHVTHRPFHWVCKSGAETVNKETGEVTVCHKRNGYRFSIITGTVFQDTKRPLRDWFTVALLMLDAKKGISSLNVQRIMGFKKEKTAWYMCHRIRAAMKDESFAKLLGVVEIDETFIGGKEKNKHLGQRNRHNTSGKGKAIVIGAIARKGNVVCKMIDRADRDTMMGFVREAVARNVKLVVTDEHHGYDTMGDSGRPHQFIKHGENEYVRGIVHTNTIESFWSLLKRGVMGSFHHVSAKYLPLYLAEFQFRFNHRKSDDMFGEVIAGC